MTTTSSNNFTGLYGGGTATVNPNTAYGNANVVGLLSAGTDGANTVGNITAAGNIVSSGNVTANYFIGDGSQLTNLPGGGSYGNANVAAFLPTYTGAMTAMTGAVTTTANISGNYYIGNGSLLTGISGTGTYGDANVVTLMGAFGSNTIVTTGNITGGNFVGSGAALSSITGGNVTGTVASATSATTAGTVTTAAQPNITSTGTLTSVATSGTISATGNITGNYYIGNGSLLTGIAASTYGDANVVSLMSAFGSNTISTTGNINSGNIIVPNGSRYRGDFTSLATAGRSVFQTTNANTAAPTFISVIPGPNHTAGASTTGAALAAFSTNDTGNASIFGTFSQGADARLWSTNTGTGTVNDMTFRFGQAGNIGATLTSAGAFSAVGNITGNYYIGNGSQLTGITATAGPGGSNTQIQFNNAGVLAGNANVTFDVSTGNLDTYNNRLTTGNVTTTVQPFDDSVVSGTVVNPGRIIFGTGVNGNLTAAMDASNWLRGSLFLVNQNVTKGDNGRRLAGAAVDIPVTLSANLANASTRVTASRHSLTIGGANVYGMTSTNVNAWPSAVNAQVTAGTNGNVIVGNIAMTGAQAVSFGVSTTGTSTIGTAVGVRNDFSGNISNCTSLTSTSSLSAVGNVVSIVQNAAANHNTNFRSSTEYYFLNNTDDVAQNKLGSLRRYTEFNFGTGGNIGNITVNKFDGQVQQITPGGTIDSITYSGFVPDASDGTNTDQQADTVTLIIAQSNTPFSVTMPTGAAYKYAAGITTVSATANSVSMISITCVNINGVTTYLTTISPAFI